MWYGLCWFTFLRAGNPADRLSLYIMDGKVFPLTWAHAAAMTQALILPLATVTGFERLRSRTLAAPATYTSSADCHQLFRQAAVHWTFIARCALSWLLHGSIARFLCLERFQLIAYRVFLRPCIDGFVRLIGNSVVRLSLHHTHMYVTGKRRRPHSYGNRYWQKGWHVQRKCCHSSMVCMAAILASQQRLHHTDNAVSWDGNSGALGLELHYRQDVDTG